MKLVEIYSNQFNVIGPGGQHRSLMIARGLSRYYNYEVYLVTPWYRIRYEDLIAQPHRLLEREVFADAPVKKLKAYLANGLALPLRALTGAPAIVVLPSPVFRANVSAAKKLMRSTVILDFGDVWYSRRDPRLYKRLSTLYLIAMIKGFVDYVVMPTRSMTELARMLLPERLRGRVVHIASSIDTDIIRPTRKSDRPRIAYIGSLVGRGVEMLPYIARETLRRCGGAEFVVVGTGPLRGWLERKVADLGLSKAFTFIGDVEFGKLSGVCGDCWIGLSLVHENTIYPVDVLKSLLYMALAMPVVSYIHIEEAEGALVNVPRPEPAFFVEAICSLIKDDATREELSRAARQRASKLYDIRVSASRYHRLLTAPSNID